MTRKTNRRAEDAAARQVRCSGQNSIAENNDSLPFKQARRKRGAIVGRDRLTWRAKAGGFALYYGHARQALAYVMPDPTWPGMFRMQLPDGQFSDLANLSRIKDAACATALKALNSKAQETAAAGPPARQIERAAISSVPPLTCASGGTQ